MDITVGYEPAPDEVTRAFLRGLRRQLTAVYAVLTAALLAGAAVFFARDDLTIAVALLLSVVLAPLGSAWWLRRRVRRQLAFLCVPTTVRVTDDGYECRTEASSTTMRWSMFSDVAATSEFWLLFVNRQPAAFLPKSAFDAEQRAEIDGFLAARRGTAPQRG